jgi:glycosyltransferase involved in cell wall biosynthesis
MIPAFPKISIITPSYNQGKFLETTILSVISQNYPNLEYIIMDGGSTDESVEIIKKYSDNIAYWQSCPDNGQADAIFRGFERSTGEILAWINSDDYYLPGSLLAIAEQFMKYPQSRWIVGNGIIVDPYGKTLYRQNKYPPIRFKTMFYSNNIVFQPATFWRRDLFLSTGGFDRTLRFAFDYELFLKFSKVAPPQRLNRDLAAFRLHETSKTMTIHDVSAVEAEKIRGHYTKDLALSLPEKIGYPVFKCLYPKVAFFLRYL